MTTSELMIPSVLRKDDYRFIKLDELQKCPTEKKWQNENNYRYDSPELQDHLGGGKNYGVLTGEEVGNLMVIDCDDDYLKEYIENLPKTFKIRTGGAGYHYYYRCDNISIPIRLHDFENDNNVGDILWGKKHAVGPNCTHPNGMKYTICNNFPIRKIDIKTVIDELEDWMYDYIRDACIGGE